MEKNDKRSVKAIKKLHRAAVRKKLAEKIVSETGCTDWPDKFRAERDMGEAMEMLKPDTPPVIKAGEVMPTDGEFGQGELALQNTLDDPNWINIDASHSRMERVLDAQCLDTAVDAAESINAQNSLEKMLAHQMAACHDKAMKIMGKLDSEIQNFNNRYQNQAEAGELQRLGNTAVRLIKCYQDGLLAIQKIRTGGKQIIQHQYVNVNDGGQAVVAANMKTGGQNTGGDNEK